MYQVAVQFDPPPLSARARGIWGFVGPLISIAILISVAFQLRGLDWRQVWSTIPTSPLIWLVLAGSYLAPPMADWLIFRRLWGIPFSGFMPLIGKMVGNELLLGYIGEVYFYDWARKNANLRGSPFGAVKDVAIISALAGNAVTLGMLAIAWPMLEGFPIGFDTRMTLLSVTVVLLISIFVLLFRGRLLSLPARELRTVLTLHLGRIFAVIGLIALTWHLLLPGVALTTWLLLSTVRMLLSRLPFIPNKEIVFVGATTLLIGHHTEIADIIAMIASLFLAAHIILGLGLMTADLVRGSRLNRS
jgi:hypothetical protein